MSDDQVTSQKIREADGTSGQNTNSGSGVKTNHLQNAAVTTPKIADGAVSTLKLLNGAVTAQKLGIVCPDGQYLQFTSASGWACSIGTPGPEGPAGLQGPTGPEGPAGPAGLAPHYANVIVVATSGGDYSDPLSAINSIEDASATNPYLIKVMPGVYDLGYSGLTMKEYVDLEGSGEQTSVITSAVEVAPYATVSGAANSEIRFVTIQNIGTGPYAKGFIKSGTLTHVTVLVSGTQNNVGIHALTGVMVLQDVHVNVSGGTSATGVNGGRMRNVTVTVSATGNALGAWGGDLDNVTITVSGGASVQGLSAPNIATIKHVTVTATGASCTGIGFDSYTGLMALTDVTVSATATAGACYGIKNPNGTLTLTNSTVAASAAGGDCYGLETFYGAKYITNCTITASNGFSNYGMYNQGSARVLIDRSTLEGSTNSVRSVGTMNIGGSKLIGPIMAWYCAATYDGNYRLLNNLCE